MPQIEEALKQYRRVMPQFFITSVTHIPVIKKIDNVTGDELLIDSNSNIINVYIVRKTSDWWFDKTGEIQGGNALMLVKHDQIINKNDKIIWNNNTYRVKNILNRDNLGGQIAYKACNLFLI